MSKSKVKERPILFSGEMVRAILAGRKTQTRRVMKPQPPDDWRPICFAYYWPIVVDRHGEDRDGEMIFGAYDDECGFKCPYGGPGQRLWVRETWGYTTDYDGPYILDKRKALYRADQHREIFPDRWRPSIHMPHWASRITLEITEVRAQRLQEISHRDALAEGVAYDVSKSDGAPLDRFRDLWNRINGKKHPWESNPWVWAISFKQVDS